MRGYVIEKMSLGELPRWYVLNEQPPRQPVAGPFDTEEAAQADAFVIVGTSLNVYPAASLVRYAPPHCPIFVIDPNAVEANTAQPYQHIRKGASEGMQALLPLLPRP